MLDTLIQPICMAQQMPAGCVYDVVVSATTSRRAAELLHTQPEILPSRPLHIPDSIVGILCFAADVCDALVLLMQLRSHVLHASTSFWRRNHNNMAPHSSNHGDPLGTPCS